MQSWLRLRIARISTTAAATAALAAGGASVLAQEAPPTRTVSLRTPDKWQAGEVFTVSECQTMDVDMTMSAPGAEPMKRKVSKRAESKMVWRCVEADADGTPKRAHVWIQSWESCTDPQQKDNSATGSFVEVTPGKRTTLSAPAKWSSEAKAWVEKKLRLGSRAGGTPLDDLDVPEALTVGETLKFPGEKLMKAFGSQAPAGVDLSKLELTLRVDSAEPTPRGTLATLSMGFNGPFGPTLATREGPTQLGEGSGVKGSGKGHVLVGASHREQDFTMDVEMTMLLSSDGRNADARATVHIDTRHAPGGDMPEVPKTAPVPPTAKDPPAPLPPPPPK